MHFRKELPRFERAIGFDPIACAVRISASKVDKVAAHGVLRSLQARQTRQPSFVRIVFALVPKVSVALAGSTCPDDAIASVQARRLEAFKV